MTVTAVLPKGFEHLSEFLDYWCVETSQERWIRRCEASMESLRRFYDVMLENAENALTHLDDFSLDQLPEAEKNLFLLLLALTNVSMAVELHGQPRAPHSPWPHGIKVLKGAAPYGGAVEA